MSIKTDRSELILKLLATAAVTAVFAMLLAGALYITPAPVRQPDSPSPPPHGALQAPPLPPDTVTLHSEAMPEADIHIMSSRLGPEGITRFYVRELERLGWRSLTAPPEPGMEGRALYFTDGARHCIINIDEQDAYTTNITLILSAGKWTGAENPAGGNSR